MKKAQGTAEKLLRTDSYHWNGYALRFLVEVKESGLFSSEDQALELYREAIDTAVEHYEQPLKAERAVEKLLEKLTEEQRLQIYQAVYRYLKQTEYGTEEEPVDLGPVLAILKVRTKQPESPSWGTTARERLRDLVRKELDLLPTTLTQLDPKDRVAALCKLIPYVLPKDEEQQRPTVTTW
jgi:hypothetical protein